MQWELRIKESSLDRSPSALLLHAERTMAFGIKEKIFFARIKVRDPTYMCKSERELVCWSGDGALRAGTQHHRIAANLAEFSYI